MPDVAAEDDASAAEDEDEVLDFVEPQYDVEILDGYMPQEEEELEDGEGHSPSCIALHVQNGAMTHQPAMPPCDCMSEVAPEVWCWWR